eukprot:Awhi_evm2s814
MIPASAHPHIVVHSDEPSTYIAYALSSEPYSKLMKQLLQSQQEKTGNCYYIVVFIVIVIFGVTVTVPARV